MSEINVKDLLGEEFLSEVKSLALRIAMRQREENHLQGVEVLKQKFLAEMMELAETDHAWDELPDVLYYGACLLLQGDTFAVKISLSLAHIFGVTFDQLKAATLAKYRRRASGLPKDIEAERSAIMAAVAQS